MEKAPKHIVSEMGSRLLQSSHPNKGSLVKSLREAATTLSQIEQPLVTETVSKKQALKLLEAELKPLKKSIIKHDLPILYSFQLAFQTPLRQKISFTHKFDQMDDTSIFDALTLLLDELTFTKAQTIREKFLERIGANHQLFHFLRILSTKCAPTIFSSEHVRYLLEQLSNSTSADTQLKASFIKLLLFSELLEDNDSFADEVTETLSKAAPYISANFSDYSTVLEKMCLEGTRSQAKHAVSAIASLARHLKNLSFPSYARLSFLQRLQYFYYHDFSHQITQAVDGKYDTQPEDTHVLFLVQSLRYINGFIRNATREAGGVDQRDVDHSLIVQINMIVFLIHVLAHDPDFPSEDCMDEHVYARFCGPMLSVLLSNKETVLIYLTGN
ncbi:hypothetical protein F2Q69_00008101 [Brassica cretica]|uniref:Uncharacterized protein n=1 Tax=Brassica cretica TaxID=69181 RepID=A0A8S9NPK2_BRACR|nr:hypothetical protein F2Q69_00008101 [Brassica cretica]